ncbi:MAG: cupin domain-containing protein, partial [Candidatus Limnocylindrales bacterium]
GEGLDNITIQVQEFKVGAPFGSYHYHEGSYNIYFVIDGTVNAFVDGESHVLQQGDLLFIPAGSPHRTTNGGSTTARALEIYAPPTRGDSHKADDPSA